MKNLRIALFLIASIMVTSCDDAIDITQPSELLPEVTYQTIDDLELGLNGVYGAVPGESAIYFTSLFTDEVAIGVNNGGQGTNGELAFLLNSNTGDPSTMWLGYYSLINTANRVIDGAEFVEVEAGSEDEAAKNDILAQVRALRAYGHLMLMAYFCPDMTNDSSLGVIALDFVPPSDAKLPRNTAGEVYSLILSDLDYADENLTEVSGIARRKYITPGAILSIRARLAAYRGQYELAKQYVDLLDADYNLSGQTGSASAKLTAYNNIFNDITTSTSNESIWQLERVPSPSSPTIGNFYQIYASVDQTIDGSPFFEVSRALFNSYAEGDVRKYVVVDPSAVVYDGDYQSLPRPQYLAEDILPVGKYRETDGAPLNGDIKVFRFSEMVFIRAEYYANLNDFANVATEINKIRTARNAETFAVPSTSDQAWAMILDERRRELAFEGHRYIDIKRLGVKANRGIDRDPADCNFNGFCTLPATDYRFTMPIPLDELTANPNIQQNPGYGDN